uniref:Transmembrane protein n=1 Tax=Arundo donax TaxID=35708 RepID=A0A0A9DYM3_ARUDO
MVFLVRLLPSRRVCSFVRPPFCVVFGSVLSLSSSLDLLCSVASPSVLSSSLLFFVLVCFFSLVPCLLWSFSHLFRVLLFVLFGAYSGLIRCFVVLMIVLFPPHRCRCRAKSTWCSITHPCDLRPHPSPQLLWRPYLPSSSRPVLLERPRRDDEGRQWRGVSSIGSDAPGG